MAPSTLPVLSVIWPATQQRFSENSSTSVAKPCILTSAKCDFSLETSVILLGVKADAS